MLSPSLLPPEVTSETDFQWLSQMRYYWEEDNMITRMINSQLAYGYEYLGNSSRLVITPLTDRFVDLIAQQVSGADPGGGEGGVIGSSICHSLTGLWISCKPHS